MLAVERVPPEDVSSYGIVAIDESVDLGRGVHRITDLVEKPRARGGAVEPRDHRPLHPHARHLPGARSHRARSHRRDPADQRPAPTAAATRPIYACEIDGVRHDTGNKLGFLKALVYFALRRPDLAEPFRRYLESLDLKISAGTLVLSRRGVVLRGVSLRRERGDALRVRLFDARTDVARLRSWRISCRLRRVVALAAPIALVAGVALAFRRLADDAPSLPDFPFWA